MNDTITNLKNFIASTFDVNMDNIFLIGSRYFDYHHQESDYDFLICLPEGSLSDDNIELLIKKHVTLIPLGFKLVRSNGYANLARTRNINSSHFELGDGVDLIFVDNQEYYNTVVNEHKIIKEYISSKDISNILRRFKSRYTGKELFLIIRGEAYHDMNKKFGD